MPAHVSPPQIPEGDTPRLRLARQVRALREEGLRYIDVAALMGISRAYASDLDHDPTGAKMRERHERARGTCVDCGVPTAWPGGRGHTNKRCKACASKAATIWTRAVCIAALRAFHQEHGRVPTAGELGGGQNHHEYVDGLPWYQALRERFGSAAAAMRAAGLEPRPVGRYARPSKVTARAR